MASDNCADRYYLSDLLKNFSYSNPVQVRIGCRSPRTNRSYAEFEGVEPITAAVNRFPKRMDAIGQILGSTIAGKAAAIAITGDRLTHPFLL